jgi:hypothetical protein
MIKAFFNRRSHRVRFQRRQIDLFILIDIL